MTCMKALSIWINFHKDTSGQWESIAVIETLEAMEFSDKLITEF